MTFNFMEETYQEKWDRILKEAKEELQTNPSIQEYLRQFNTASVNSFLEHYAKQKATWLAFSPVLTSIDERELDEDIEKGWEMLCMVQLKKILNLEIRWRAEKITIPGFEVTDDFLNLMSEALETHEIPPISEKEFALVLSYVESCDELFPDFTELFYWDLVDPDSPTYFTDQYPEFYRLYDTTFGNADLLDLPDIRGEKEKKYREAWQKLSGTEPGPYVPLTDPLMKPWFNPYGDEQDFVGQYLRRFESPENRADLESTIEVRRRYRPYSQTDEYLRRIQEMGIPVHLTEQSNIPDAVRIAYFRAKLMNTCRLLPGIYKEYLRAWEEKKPMPFKNPYAFMARIPKTDEYKLGREALRLPFDGYV